LDLQLVAGVIVGLVALWALMLGIFWVSRPKDVPVREVIRVIPDVLRLLRSLITDSATPLDVRLGLAGLMLWIISPIDLIPEFIPGLGPLDDVIVAIVALRYTRRRLGVNRLRDRWVGTDDGFSLLIRIVGSGQ
jgi:uncharacterized membrane protein YkvA (DUF1232 family)